MKQESIYREKKKGSPAGVAGKAKMMIDEINGQNPHRTDEEYHKYYEICDKFPFAFTDIEMVFNEKTRALPMGMQHRRIP